MKSAEIVAYLREAGPVFILNGARMFWDTLKKYKLHVESNSVPEFLDSSACSVDGCSSYCQIYGFSFQHRPDGPSYLFFTCELAGVLAQVVDSTTPLVLGNQWFHFRNHVQRIDDIPDMIGNLLLRSTADAEMEIIFPSLRDNPSLSLIDSPAAPTTLAKSVIAGQMLRIVASSSCPLFSVFWDGRPNVNPNPADARSCRSMLLRTLVQVIASPDQAAETEYACAETECKALDTANYNLLVAGKLRLLSSSPDVFATLSLILNLSFPSGAVGPPRKRIVEARELAFGDVPLFEYMHRLSGRIHDTAFQTALVEYSKKQQLDNNRKSFDAAHVVLFVPTASSAWCKPDDKLFGGGAGMGPQLLVDNGRFCVVSRKLWAAQQAGGNLFALVVTEPDSRLCIYPCLARMFASFDIDQIRWCVAICHYWIFKDITAALATSKSITSAHLDFYVSTVPSLISLLLEGEDLYLLMKDREDEQESLVRVFLTLMIATGEPTLFTLESIPGTLFGLYKRVHGEAAALELSTAAWIIKVKSPVKPPTAIRLLSLIRMALEQCILTRTQVLSLLQDLTPLSFPKKRIRRRLPSRCRERSISTGGRNGGGGVTMCSGMRALFALGDFMAMANASPGCAWHHMCGDSMASDAPVFEDLRCDQLFYLAGPLTTYPEVADSVVQMLEKKAQELAGLDKEIAIVMADHKQLNNL